MKVEGKQRPDPSARAKKSEPEAGLNNATGGVSSVLSLVSYQLAELSALSHRALNSFKARGLGPTLRIIAKRLFPTRRRPLVLQLHADISNARKVRFETVPAEASIIIPVHNQLQFTLRCLQSLTCAGDATPFEVIVVDDASTDDSAAVLPAIAGLRYLRNAQNAGFIDSCNSGARIASGRFLVFLNNDTVVQPGWLDSLLKTFDDHPDTGLAGSKLVHADGRLQEAGGTIFADGQAANYGRNEDPSHPRFNFVREVDYCSGAALAMRSELFTRLGGFDAHYRPAYFEDTDLAMRVRQQGLKVRYQPASVVVHFEGASSGTDPRRGIKAYQLLNQEKFFARWGERLALMHPTADPLDVRGIAAELAALHGRGRRVLVIDSYTPTPDRDSGSVRMFELMRLLLEEGCSVVFISQSLQHDGRYTDALQQLGVEVWWRPWVGNLPRWLHRHGPRFDAILVSRHYVLSPLLPVLRRFAPQARVVFDTVDLHFLREQREAERSGSPALRQAAERTRNSELELVRAADTTWVVSAVERELLNSLEPGADVRIVSNIHHVNDSTPDFEARADLVFVGSFRHPPNVDAASWLVSDIYPLLRAKLPTVRLHLVGGDASESVAALGMQPGVIFHGHVPDLEGLLDRSRISLAPLRFGAGIKGKVNQALARGLPVVATSCAIEGTGLIDGSDVLCADDAGAFAQAILRLYQDAMLWRTLRAGGIQNIQSHFSQATARAEIGPWLRNLSPRKAL